MTTEAAAILGRILISLLAIVGGALFVYWGYRLFSSPPPPGGPPQPVGDIDVTDGTRRFRLSKPAAGSMLAAMGGLVILAGLISAPDFSKSEQQRVRPKEVVKGDTLPNEQQPVSGEIYTTQTRVTQIDTTLGDDEMSGGRPVNASHRRVWRDEVYGALPPDSGSPAHPLAQPR